MSEWYAKNSHRAYPLLEDSPGVYGGKPLPLGLLVDAQHLELALGSVDVALVRVTIDGFAATLRLAAKDTAGVEIYTRDILLPLSAGAGYTATASDENGQTRFVLGDGIAELLDWDEGIHDGAPSLLEPTCTVSHADLRLESIKGMADSVPVAGDIHFQEGNSIRVRLGTGRIRFDAIPGAGAGRPCTAQAVGEDDDCARFVQLFNGVPAGPDGKLDLRAGKGVRIINNPAHHTIIIEFDSRKNERGCG